MLCCYWNNKLTYLLRTRSDIDRSNLKTTHSVYEEKNDGFRRNAGNTEKLWYTMQGLQTCCSTGRLPRAASRLNLSKYSRSSASEEEWTWIQAKWAITTCFKFVVSVQVMSSMTDCRHFLAAMAWCNVHDPLYRISTATGPRKTLLLLATATVHDLVLNHIKYRRLRSRLFKALFTSSFCYSFISSLRASDCVTVKILAFSVMSRSAFILGWSTSHATETADSAWIILAFWWDMTKRSRAAREWLLYTYVIERSGDEVIHQLVSEAVLFTPPSTQRFGSLPVFKFIKRNRLIVQYSYSSIKLFPYRHDTNSPRGIPPKFGYNGGGVAAWFQQNTCSVSETGQDRTEVTVDN